MAIQYLAAEVATVAVLPARGGALELSSSEPQRRAARDERGWPRASGGAWRRWTCGPAGGVNGATGGRLARPAALGAANAGGSPRVALAV